MSLEKNNKFLTEFNRLDSILKDMYPCQEQSRLGISRYMDKMREIGREAAEEVPDWWEDYNELKRLRNQRNEAVHENLMDSELFTDADIQWITNFKSRVLKQTDPIAMLTRFKLPPKQEKPTPKKETVKKTPTKTTAEMEENSLAVIFAITFFAVIIPAIVVAVVILMNR